MKKAAVPKTWKSSATHGQRTGDWSNGYGRGKLWWTDARLWQKPAGSMIKWIRWNQFSTISGQLPREELQEIAQEIFDLDQLSLLTYKPN